MVFIRRKIKVSLGRGALLWDYNSEHIAAMHYNMLRKELRQKLWTAKSHVHNRCPDPYDAKVQQRTVC